MANLGKHRRDDEDEKDRKNIFEKLFDDIKADLLKDLTKLVMREPKRRADLEEDVKDQKERLAKFLKNIGGKGKDKFWTEQEIKTVSEKLTGLVLEIDTIWVNALVAPIARDLIEDLSK